MVMNMKLAYVTKEEEEFLYSLYQENKLIEPYKSLLFSLILELEQRRKRANDSAYYQPNYQKKYNNNFNKTAK